MKFPLLARAAVLAAVAIALLVPLGLVASKVAERQRRAAGVAADFARETSGPQAVVGPLLVLACEETVVEERVVKRAGKEDTVAEQKVRACPPATYTPRVLAIDGTVPVESLARGIFPIRLYRASLAFRGEFDWPAPPAQDGALSRRWTRASLAVATGDARGIKGASPVAWGPGSVAFAPARGDVDPRFSLEAALGDHAALRPGEPVAFRFRLDLAGTDRLLLGPVGDASTLRLSSPWPHPSFTGAFAPDERRVGPEGFEATWRTTHFATGGASAWQTRLEKGKPVAWDKVAGFALADPVNAYSLSYRATEYGFLFVLFTFAALALAEATAGVRLHPVQYGLVGSALAVFFLLLVALAEHVAFGVAYAASATACATLLTFYLRAPLASGRRAAAFLALFAALYGALYALLRSEDHALLAGSLLVFAVLATGMVATRRVDWAAVARRGGTMAPPEPPGISP